MKRSVLLDLLRVFAISLVFIAHFSQLLDWPLEGFFGIKNVYYISLGGVGVSLFLILSGVLAGLGGQVGINQYGRYLLKKCLRIYPLYWMSVVISIAAYLVGSRLMHGEFNGVFPNGPVLDILGSLTGFYSWMGYWGGPYNSPSWFIALIIFMYAVFPLMYFFIKKAPHFAVLSFLVLSVISRVYIGQKGVPFVEQSFVEGVVSFFYRQYGFMPGRPGDWFPLCRVFEFALGIYLAVILPKSVWFYINIPFKKCLFTLSDLAFPMFLIHYPVLFVIVFMQDKGVPVAIAISVFMTGVLLLSYLMMELDKRLRHR